LSYRKDRLEVTILGATGIVGQHLVHRLAGHPWFRVGQVTASERSAGRSYGEAVSWRLGAAPPSEVADLEVRPTSVSEVSSRLVFSALDADVARVVEPELRAAGHVVVSNASAFRMDPEVPLLIPEVNPDHVELARAQLRRWGGAIVANPNCSTIGLCLALDPLRREFGLRSVTVTTLQALSGAGYPGVASLETLDSVLPEIGGEEDKLRHEPSKIFGTRRGDGIETEQLAVSAQCNRVPVRDGHLLSIAVQMKEPASIDDARRAYLEYVPPTAGLDLPSAPERPVQLLDLANRPQTLLDRDREGGMAVTVGRLEPCPVHDFRCVAVVHNVIRGAAGGTILVAELLTVRGLLERE